MNELNPEGKTVIVGLGKTGLSCVRFLVAQGLDVMVVDSRSEPPGLETLYAEWPSVEIQLGKFDAELFAGAQMLVVSPGVPVAHPAIVAAIAAGVPVVGDIELFAQHAKAPVVAITGSNGKSTVTTMVYEMACLAGKQTRVGGNIGIPALDLLRSTEPDLYVLELSSFQLETTSSLKPAAAVVLNISQDHLDRYRDMKAYINAKKRIYTHAEMMVVNADDPVVAQWCVPGRPCFNFSLNGPGNDSQFGVSLQGGARWLARGKELLMPVADMKVVGMHNVANALAALALGEAVGLPMDAMLNALRQFAGLPHRCQWIGEQDGVAWYNDSKATNVGAAVAAISGMTSRVILIAGGEGKGQAFEPLQKVMAEKGAAAILIGRDAAAISRALGNSVPVKFAANLNEAVNLAKELAQPGDVVLLAPACASFDMFSGYEDRGEQFVVAVERVLQ